MKILWRDDVRFERVSDIDGIRYAIPFTEGKPLSKHIGLGGRNRELAAVRAEKRRERNIGLPKNAPIRRQLVHQETAGAPAVQRVASERAMSDARHGTPPAGVENSRGLKELR